MADNMTKPAMYPCASRVQMPEVGADETVFKSIHEELKPQRLPPPKKQPHALNKYYIKKISTGLSFSEDVVRERCFHALPYDKKYLAEVLDISDIIKRPPPTRKIIGRHNAHGPDLRHMPCHIGKKKIRKLKPIECDEGKQNHLRSSLEESQSMSDITGESGSQKGSFFMTETDSGDTRPSTVPKKQDNQWDQYLLSIMSKTTAEWIVKKKVTPSEYRERLEKFLEERYGPLPDQEPELIKDTASESDFDGKEQSSKPVWKKADVNMLEKVRKMTAERGLPTDPYCDDNSAAFYRLPAGFRRAKKYQDKEEAGAINTTAYRIEVKTYKPPPPPTLRDYINPKVGDKLYDTDNRFIQEWLTGARQVYQRDGDEKVIVMDSNNRYRKTLEKECPQQSDTWYNHETGEGRKLKVCAKKLYQRGLKRWKALPEPIDPNERLVSAQRVDSRRDVTLQDTAQKISDQSTGGDTSLPKPSECGKRPMRPSSVLLRIVDDWRAKWQLDMRYTDATPDDLIRDMADLHPHIRLKAITTCARAAEYSPPPSLGIQLNSEATRMEHVRLLPEKLFIALEICLDDENLQVKRAAAVALYTLNRPTPKAEEILRQALYDEKAIDRWTAAQCLAYFGECDSDVVSELISQLMTTEDTVKHEQAAALLSRLSENSTLVHSMIGEQLNSSSWRHRVMACHLLPKLEGKINKDLVNKLTHLMWTDWHHEVRKVAAQTLGKTGHGKHIHDELRDKIINGNERMRTEAVCKVGQLGIMTAKLLVAFLRCFDDQYVSVRIEVCRASSSLRITDEQVLDKLVGLATYDPIWKVKALAIQALGTIGVVNKSIRDCILWAFRYEGQDGVRVEACHTIRRFGLREPEVAHILQDRYLVESSDIVKEEIVAALEMFDISPAEDLDMVTQIKEKVHKLCTRNNICAQITVIDKELTHERNVERLIYQPPDTPRRSKDPARYRKPASRAPPTGEPGRPLAARSDGSSRPYSQETTDREIQAIFDRYDDDDDDNYYRTSPPSTNRRSGTNPDTTLSGFTPDKQKSRESPGTGSYDADDDGVNNNNNSEAEVTSRPKSYVTFASPEPVETERDESESDDNENESDPAQRRRILGEAQTYVEITGNPEQPGIFSDHVLAVAHSSPGESNDGMTSPPDLDLSTDSGNMPSLTSSANDDMIGHAVHVTHSPDNDGQMPDDDLDPERQNQEGDPEGDTPGSGTNNNPEEVSSPKEADSDDKNAAV